MKKLFFIGTFFLVSIAFAQEKPKNVSEETEKKTVTINDGEKVVEKKVKVTTKEEQKIKLDAKDKHQVNQEIVETPTKVTKTIEVDSDNDVFYDTKTEVSYYTFNDQKYTFQKSSKGFNVSLNDDIDGDLFGHAIRASRNNNYLYKSDDYTGIGYFDDQGNFVVEYYDKDSNGLVKKEFILIE
ncbi:MAG TPA: hypothetical protein VKN14_13375 [Flavobacteriaceae bacterium]|nr:hypothetical protein [Flavobacteriaceae bacterium]